MGHKVITYSDYERLMLMLARDVKNHIALSDVMHRLCLILRHLAKLNLKQFMLIQ